MSDHIHEVDMWLASLGPDGSSESVSEFMMRGALMDEEDSDLSTSSNAESSHATQSADAVPSGLGTGALISHPAPPPQQPAPVVAAPASNVPRQVRFALPPPPAATTAPRPVAVDNGFPEVSVPDEAAQTMNPFAFSPESTTQPRVKLPRDPVAVEHANPFLVAPEDTVQLQGAVPNADPYADLSSFLPPPPPRVQNGGSEEDLYGVSDSGDGSDNGVSGNGGIAREEPRPAPRTRLERRLRSRQKRLGRHHGPPARARRWDLAEMAGRRDTDSMLRLILRAVGDDMASHIAHRSVLAAWWQLSAYPTHTATLRRGEVWLSRPGRTESIIRDTVDDLFKRRDLMREAVLADPLDTRNWVDLNAWFKLEGPYRLSMDVDDYEYNLPDSRDGEFDEEFSKAKDMASRYIHAVKQYKDEVEEMDWIPGGDDLEPEPEEEEEEEDEEDNNGLSELNIVQPRKPENLYETAAIAGFGPEMKRSMIGLDLADIMRWKPQDQEKGFWKK